jgi:hypothetical protein
VFSFGFIFLFRFFFYFCLLDNTGLGSSESFEMINNETQENSADTGGGK